MCCTGCGAMDARACRGGARRGVLPGRDVRGAASAARGGVTLVRGRWRAGCPPAARAAQAGAPGRPPSLPGQVAAMQLQECEGLLGATQAQWRGLPIKKPNVVRISPYRLGSPSCKEPSSFHHPISSSKDCPHHPLNEGSPAFAGHTGSAGAAAGGNLRSPACSDGNASRGGRGQHVQRCAQQHAGARAHPAGMRQFLHA